VAAKTDGGAEKSKVSKSKSDSASESAAPAAGGA
jgi:hypothetical protein